MPLRAQAALASFLAFGLMGPVACSGGGDGRTPSSGKQANQDIEKPAATEGENANGADATTNVGTGEGGEGSAAIPNGKSIEQCTQEKKAWRAVVDGGKAPTDCLGPLVTWCCTRAEISNRFPSMTKLVEAKFDEFIGTENLVLYHCSENAAEKKFTFHLGKIGNGTTSYKTVFISGINPVGDAGGTGCTQPTTADLQAAGQGSATATGTSTGTGTTATFTADVKPVLTAKCGGAACHDDGGTQPANSQWIDDETKFKASDSLARVKAAVNPMPPDTSAALTPEEKAKLVEFLTP